MSACEYCGTPVVPVSVEHRPGLSELALRIGTHRTFLADMRARLSSADLPALAALTTHETPDPAAALLDAWAVVADVLTFYQERIGNEGYLRTATERRSLLEQAALVGYRPRPGVAASTYLAYTIDENADPVELPVGARVNSVPGPGEVMQTFETTEPLVARHEWNQLGVRQARPQLASDVVADGLVLSGTTTGLAVGDALLLDLGLGLDLTPARVRALEADPEADRTRVTLESWSGAEVTDEVVRATVRVLAGTAAVEVDPDGATAKKVLDAFAQVEERARAGDASSASALAAALDLTRRELEVAQRHGWTRLAVWLEEGMLRLGRVWAASGTTRPERFALRGTRRAAGDLTELLDDLAAPPSLQPRGSRQLGRSVATALARGADAYPALLSAMRPALASSLYGALSRLDDAAPVSPLRVWALRLAVPLFGHNAPQEAQFNSGAFTGFSEWSLAYDEAAEAAFLDRDHPDVLVGTLALVTRPATHGFEAAVVTDVKAVEQLSRRAYGLAGKSTRVTFADQWWRPSDEDGEGGATLDVDDFDVLRAAVVRCGAEELTLADAPIGEAVCDDEIELDRLYDGLRSGRWMVLSGERADISGTSGVRAAELVMLAGVTQRVATVSDADHLSGGWESDDGGEPANVPLPGDALHTFVTLASPLAYCYRRDTVVLHGNVVRATHGETTQEVLGGGDPRRLRQTFKLKQPPLTWTSAPTVTGIDTTLDVRVDDVSWHEARSMVELGPSSHQYLTRQDDAGATTVVFGDGVHGARLPSGTDNVRAIYRKGIGKDGNVAAGQLSQLATRPLGIKDVVNPLNATGGADAESRDQVRRNAPLAVLALDRLVSTQDHADFARTFAGVAKASAARLSDGRRQLVHVTIAGVDDAPIDETSDLFRNLTDALHRFGDPALPLKVSVRRLLALVVSAGVKVLPDHHWDTVEPPVRAAVLAVCGFDRRELGEDVLPSEVVAAMQAVRGVDYVDLDVLAAVSAEDVVRQLAAGVGHGQDLEDARPAPPRAVQRRPAPRRVVVQLARLVDEQLRPAELAYLQPGVPDSLILNEIRDEVAR